MKKRVAIISTNRADFSLLYPLIIALRKREDDNFSVELIVSGSHTCAKFGNTIEDIRRMNVRIDYIIPMEICTDTEFDIVMNQATILQGIAGVFGDNRFDAIVILGDRYEMLTVAMVALNFRIPIIHLYGGDITEGAVDEYIRHAITKMSYLHFVSNEHSLKRVIQMGEDPKRVFNYGALGTDNALRIEKYTKKEALCNLNLPLCDYALCTYHPVTLEPEHMEERLFEFLEAISLFPQIQFIMTKANFDFGGEQVNKLMDTFSEKVDNIHLYSSLDIKEYVSLMNYAEFMIGNSSSGIMEAPAFRVPSIDIGSRQRGRTKAASTITCNPDKTSIIDAITTVMSPLFKEKCKNVRNPYGKGHAGESIANEIFAFVNSEYDIKKHFYTPDIIG